MAIGTTKVGVLATGVAGTLTSVAYPASVATGDVVWVAVLSRGSLPTGTFSLGWTLVQQRQQGTATWLAVFRKNTTWRTGDALFSATLTGPVGVGGFTLSWAGARIPLDQSGDPTTNGGTTTSMSAPAVTTRTPNALVVNFYGSADDQAHGTAGGGSTAVASGASYISTAGNDFAMSAAIEAIVSPGTSGTNTMSHASGADNTYSAITLALQPAVTVTGTVGAPLGALSASVPNGHVDPTRGTSASPLGRLTTAVVGTRTTFGTAGKALGALTARAVGIRTTFGSVSAPLGQLRGNLTGGSVTALGGTDVSLNPSVWLVDRPSQILSPVTGWTRLELSPVANQPGDVGISVGVGTAAFTDLHGLVSASPQTDAEIEIWLDGRGRGNNRKRAILYQKSGDDLNAGNVWSFSGHFLEQLLAEVLVGLSGTATQETLFNGENPGTILATVFDRIKARSGLLLAGMTRDFTTARDSNGQPWDEVLGTMKYTPDTTLLEVAQDLVSLATCEFEVTPNRVFRVFNFDSRGTDHTVGTAPMRFQHGSNLREASRRESSRVGEAATAVLGKGSEGAYAWATDATAEAQRGRRVESAQDVGRLTSTAAVLAGAQARLFSLKTGVQERSHSIAFTPGAPIPLADFNIGDYAMSVTGNRLFERMRVQQWKLVFEPGTVTGDVVMNSLVQDWENLTESRLNAIMRGSTVVGTSPSVPQVDDGKLPNAPSGLVASSQAYFDASGTTYAAITASWTAVITNADFTATDDIASYIPQFRYGASSGLPTAWQTLPGGSATTIDFGGVNPGVSCEMRVAAVDRYSHVGAFSTIYGFTSAADASAPPVGSAPTVESYLGILRVIWDGRGRFGENMPADFDHAEIHISTGEDFTPSRPLLADGRLDERASTTYVDQLTGAGDRPYTLGIYDTVYYAKIVTVDRTGNAATASLAGHATLVQVGDGDIAEMNIGKLRTGFLTAIMTVSNTIRTAASGSRVELDSNGIRCFFGSRKVFDFSIPTGAMEMFGKLTAGAGVGAGPTVIVDPDSVSLKLYPDATGNFYEQQAWVQPTDGTIWESRYSTPASQYAGSRIYQSSSRVYIEHNFNDPASSKLDIDANTVVLGAKTNMLISTGSNVDYNSGVGTTVTAVGNAVINGGSGNASGAVTLNSNNGANNLFLNTGSVGLWNGASLKAFVIDHPTDPARRLVHVCTETPNAMVEYVGTASLADGMAYVELPPYFEALTEAEGRTVSVTLILPEVPIRQRVRKPEPATVRTEDGRDVVNLKRPFMLILPEHHGLLSPPAAASLPVDGRFRIACGARDGAQVSWRVTANRKGMAFDVEPLVADTPLPNGPYGVAVPKNADTGKGP